MNSDIRSGPGPRDWSPSGGSLFDAPPPRDGLPKLFEDGPTPRRSRSIAGGSYRGIGLLAILLGAGSVITALVPNGISGWQVILFLAIGPVAIIAGAIGVANVSILRPLDRITGVVGLALGTVGTLMMVGFFAGIWAGIHPELGQLPDTAPIAAPVETTTTLVEQGMGARAIPDQAAYEAETMALGQAAGTISYLLKTSYEEFGSFPTLLSPSSDGMVVTNAGNYRLPPETKVQYLPSADAQSYVLVLQGPAGGLVSFDSRINLVQPH